MQDGTLYPVNEQGERIYANGRHVKFSFESEHSAFVARCAHRRSLHHAFKSRSFSFSKRIGRNPPPVLFYLMGLSALLGPLVYGLFTYVKLQSQLDWQFFQFKYKMLLFAIVVIMSSVFGFAGVLFLMIARRIQKSAGLQSIGFLNDRIVLHFRDGKTIEHGWSDVTAITSQGVVTFADSFRIWAPNISRRVSCLFMEARDQLFPSEAQKTAALYAGIPRRLAIYVGLTAVLMFPCIRLVEDLQEESQPAIWFVPILLLVAAIVFGVLSSSSFVGVSDATRFLKYRIRKRRSAHRRAMRKQLTRGFLIPTG